MFYLVKRNFHFDILQAQKKDRPVRFRGGRWPCYTNTAMRWTFCKRLFLATVKGSLARKAAKMEVGDVLPIKSIWMS